VLHAGPDVALVYGADQVVILGRLIRDLGGGNLDTRVVEDGIQATERCNRALHHGRNLVFVNDIAHHGDRLAASGGDLIHRLEQRSLLAARQRDRSARLCKCACRIQPHAGAGDEGDLPCEVVSDVHGSLL